ncbi:MAG: HAMP domain-containing protein [Bacteroidales bacterium]|nr:HAMP domain-containing protein [Bacteroidales bacterium]
MKIKSLSRKIITITSTIIFISTLLLVIYFINTNKKNTLEKTREQIITKTEQLNLQLQTLVNNAFNVLENQNENILMLDSKNALDKQIAIDIVKINLLRDTNFTGMCLIFEPNSLCQNDNSFPELMDKGNFIPYLYHNKDLSIGMEPLVGYDIPGDGDYYLIPKETKKPLLTEPYLYPINGEIVYMITLVDALIKDGQFIGISTADYDIEFMKKFSNKIKSNSFDGKMDISIISNEGNIVVNTDDTSIVGKNLKDLTEFDYETIIQDIKTGKKEILTKGGYLIINTPILFGNTDNFWRIQFSVPEDVIFDKIRKQSAVIIFLGLILIIFSIAIIYFFVQKFIAPVKKLTEASKKLAEGDFRVNIEIKGNDEVTELSINYKHMISRFKKLVESILNTSEALLNASSQLTSTALQMAQNANEQSATTEEISSSMEEMLATVQSNTQKAEKTGEISSKSAEEIEKNNQTFLEAINSVFEISKKIAVISEIASKTDILSINAAIEAAHAGDTGRGFAVVAQEIRKLADNSRAAAKEIERISLTSQNISKEAGDKLNKIIPEIIKSAQLVENIIVANREQSTSIESINNAILQLVEITNENSAASEEMSASAEELEAQAEQLKETISIFKVQ